MIIQTVSFSIFVLTAFVFAIRLKGLYLHREIQDIVVFDRSQRQELDYDSPAILSVFYQDIEKYELEQRYYQRSPVNRYASVESGLLGEPLQRIRSLVQELSETPK